MIIKVAYDNVISRIGRLGHVSSHGIYSNDGIPSIVEGSSNCFKALVCTLNSILGIRFQSKTFLCWSMANILYFAGCFCYRSSTIPLMSQLSID